jgi:dipeptidyl aminopeptidase/acylaminoacyl peptidase
MSRLPLARFALGLALLLPLAAAAEAPPLIDRELFFGNPEIAGAQLSPDGKWVAFLKPWQDTRNVWVKRLEEPYEQAHLVTADPKRPVPGFFWSRDSKYVLFVQDRDGDENYNVFAVDPAAAPEPGGAAPAARNLTAAKGARAIIYELPRKDTDVLYIGLNDRDAAWHDLYQVRISTGERTLLKKNTERITGWTFDREGKLRLAERATEKGDTELLRVDPQGFTRLAGCGVLESCGAIQAHRDGKRVYVETNHGAPDLSRLVLLDLATGKESLVESDPMRRVDFGQALFSEDTGELMATTYLDERQRYVFHDRAAAADYQLLVKRLPGKDLVVASSTADELLWMVGATADTDPGSTYLFDRKTKALTLQYQLREKLPRSQLAPMKAIRYPSSDGRSISAFLTLPVGVAARGLPLVVFPHGGPWARDAWRYHPYAQFLANRGYAVLQPNFRGSTGYGKKFLDAGNGQWGDRMQDDLTWGVKHLVKQGVADGKRVGIMGGSYGGYATLAGVAFTPDLYAAAVSMVGPSNLLTLLETIPPYWEAGRIIMYTRMGDPGTAEGKKQLQRQSPLNSAGRITTPLLVVQGANDPRVKKAESEQIVVALRDRGFPVGYLLAPDEGHGFARPVNNSAMFAAAEAFLAQHLGGRFQEGGTPEVVARLRELTVDPKTVVLAAKVDATAVGTPRPVSDLVAGAATYLGSIAAGPQTMPITISRVTREEGGRWSITETMKLPMGDAVDATLLEKGTLLPVSRTMKQGPVTVELAFQGGKVTGTMTMGGQSKPIAVDVGGQLFADGPGSDDVLARLPLAEGYQVLFRNLDVQKQKGTLKRLTVVGAEEVTVPAGKFKTWKVEVVPAEGEPGTMNLWVAQDSRKVVKLGATLPEMGGAVLSAELQP